MNDLTDFMARLVLWEMGNVACKTQEHVIARLYTKKTNQLILIINIVGSNYAEV